MHTILRNVHLKISLISTLSECSKGTVTLECLETVGHGVHHTAFKALEYGPGPKYCGIINKNMIYVMRRKCGIVYFGSE